jgi:hypothetical protein
MSKIEVNTVEPQCGTTVTVGKCTSTVAVPGAATVTGIATAGTLKSNTHQAADGGNIINQCGTDITLGASGDTINLASGASQSGFGRTGTVDWITTPKVTGDSPITGVTGKGYFLNTTAGTITLNLPAGSAGDIISMADYAATWQTYSVTVAPDGSDKIGGVAQNVTLNTEGQSITLVYTDSTQGWINTMDSTSNVRAKPPFVVATVSGTCNTLATAPCCADTKIATFKNPGTFCVSNISPCAANNVVSYMVVAGGGAGGTDSSATSGGGGGGGGFREYKSPVTPYTSSPLDGNPGGTSTSVAISPYSITVGGGGAVVHPTAPPPSWNPGNNSVFSTITSTGGGGGGSNTPGTPSPLRQGGPGGSGGGAPFYNGPAYGSGNTPPVSPAQGTDGGAAPGAGPGYGSGGGGGATACGGNGSTSASGVGGAGATTSISATPTAYAGGGGGATWAAAAVGGAGGAGGGGTGGENSAGVNGTDNLGGGGGGAGGSPGSNTDGGTGGSGIVIIRYKFQ